MTPGLLPPSRKSAQRKLLLTLLENPDADIALFSIDRIIDRLGHLAPIRENLLARDDLPVAMRQALLSKLSPDACWIKLHARQWLGPEHC